MADQFRADCLGADGNRVIHTPNLDRIAARGRPLPLRLLLHAHVHAGALRAAHGPLAVEPRHAGDGPHGRALPVEKPRALREAGYYTTAIGKCTTTRSATGTASTRCCSTNPAAQETPEFRSDYRAWFWSQAPNLDPDATGIGWNDYPARPYALPEHLHPTAGPATRGEFHRQLTTARAVLPEGLLRPPAQPVRSAGALLEALRGRGPAGGAGGQVGRASYAARKTDRADIWHGDLGAGAGARRRGRATTARSASSTSRSAASSRRWRSAAARRDADRLHRRPRRYDRRPEPVAEVVRLRALGAHSDADAMAGGGRTRGQVLPQTVELRDMLPTFLDAAGAAPRELDGRSMLPWPPARPRGGGRSSTWSTTSATPREPLERADRRPREVHLPRFDGSEQLFDLSAIRTS